MEIRRGGGATAHNPGQLVFYPIVHLQELRLGVNEYVRTLEAIGIELLAGLGVRERRRKGFPGLWVGQRKIASVGVRVSRFVTCHGMAINIQNDLSIFNFMVPCGLDGVVMTSAQRETGKTYDMAAGQEASWPACCTDIVGRGGLALHPVKMEASGRAPRRYEEHHEPTGRKTAAVAETAVAGRAQLSAHQRYAAFAAPGDDLHERQLPEPGRMLGTRDGHRR